MMNIYVKCLINLKNKPKHNSGAIRVIRAIVMEPGMHWVFYGRLETKCFGKSKWGITFFIW